MYHGKNPSAIRSQECITDACIALIRTIPLEHVSIKQIMQHSDLARQTFYQVFDTKDEVLVFHLDRLFSQYLQGYDISAITNLCDAAKLFFRFVEVNRDFTILLVRNDRTGLLCQKIREYLQNDQWLTYSQEGVDNEREKGLAISFVIAGFTGMLVDWVQDGCQMKTEDMAKLVCRITRSEDSSWME